MVAINPRLVTTAFDLPGYRTVKNLGVVRGIVVRSRSIVGNIGAWLQTLLGGNITLYTGLCENARADAFGLMLEHAAELGANAVVGMRYDANDVAAGATEVLAYGTAVVVEDRRSKRGPLTHPTEAETMDASARQHRRWADSHSAKLAVGRRIKHLKLASNRWNGDRGHL